jgi:flavin reductase (DIM6/NTAB) family NADH-FMN oxidoreductase RutF/DNA-binding IclR family transcriptional regulator
MTTLTAFDKRQLRDVLGTFTTGVTIVTTRDAQGTAHGVTANSFSSVSLDPPLVLWSQALTSRSYPAFRDNEHFAVNILADDQVAISNHFAQSMDDKFSGIAHDTGLGGVPVLAGTTAHLECVKVATYPGGDHVVYVGRVERVGHSSRHPLAFGSGRYMVPYARDLGPMSLQLGSSTPADVKAVRMVTDTLPAIAEVVGGHTMCVAVWGNHGPTVIRWEPSSQPVSDRLRTGLVLSVTRSATGHAFAAFLPEQVTGCFIDEDFRQFRGTDEDEAVQRARFVEEIGETRSSGIACVSDPEPALLLREVAVGALSSPIFDADGAMILALTLTSHASRLEFGRAGSAAKALASAARSLSTQLGWIGSDPPAGSKFLEQLNERNSRI